MKTIIKIPLFVEINTNDGLDRKIISNAVRDFFIPEVYRVMKSQDLISWMYNSEKKKLSSVIGNNASFKILTQSDLFIPRNENIADKKPWDL